LRWLPLILYVISFVLCGLRLFSAIHKPHDILFALAASILVLGMWTAAAALFFATWLPLMLASTATIASLAFAGLCGYLWPWFSAGRLLVILTQGDLTTAAHMLRHPIGFFSIALGAVLLFAAGTLIFERRDLKLKSD
jgi:hypothetical protein